MLATGQFLRRTVPPLCYPSFLAGTPRSYVRPLAPWRMISSVPSPHGSGEVSLSGPEPTPSPLFTDPLVRGNHRLLEERIRSAFPPPAPGLFPLPAQAERRREASVLMLLAYASDVGYVNGNEFGDGRGYAPDEDPLVVLLTRRSERLRINPGDSAFPGGRVDSTDLSYLSASLREAEEEISLPRPEIERNICTCQESTNGDCSCLVIARQVPFVHHWLSSVNVSTQVLYVRPKRESAGADESAAAFWRSLQYDETATPETDPRFNPDEVSATFWIPLRVFLDSPEKFSPERFWRRSFPESLVGPPRRIRLPEEVPAEGAASARSSKVERAHVIDSMIRNLPADTVSDVAAAYNALRQPPTPLPPSADTDTEAESDAAAIIASASSLPGGSLDPGEYSMQSYDFYSSRSGNVVWGFTLLLLRTIGSVISGLPSADNTPQARQVTRWISSGKTESPPRAARAPL
ncbi:hypothetical protein H696_03827 [Fonticula alba]|uniref:Nudix hydrolase domain-containing protein n=1 Tax=Fonticula alba TaxID=691883 RepID=A0A058Z5K3_FONAL|nr:hypothetical protein H696_03827 [Fonticula alba]KCV69396.1 hypothetical protein H696_03827 [Fonticula alba]|eukprot:XP_009495961.1 hypothetical protein H696_03827 [Fonticula alba]